MKGLIIIFCFAIGFGASYYGLKLIRLYRKVKSWSKVKAKIISKVVVDKKLSKSSRQSKTVHVEYSYNVNGIEYKNDMVFLVGLIKGERGFYPDDAQRFLDRIKEEEEIYVDLNEPKNSLLFCDGIALYVFMLIMGICLLLAGIGNILSL